MSAKRRHKFSSPHLNFVVGVEFEVEVEVDVDVGPRVVWVVPTPHTYVLYLQTDYDYKGVKVVRSKKNFIAEKKVGDWILQSVGRVTKTWADFK